MEVLFIVIIFTILVIGFTLFIWTILDIFQSRRESTEKLLWVLIIIMAPLLGMLLYLIFGRKKIISKRSF